MDKYFNNSKLNFDDYEVFRNGNYIGTVKGFFTSNAHPNSIQIMQNFILKINDQLLHNISGITYTICQLKPLSSNNQLHGYIATYKTDTKTSTNISYNIKNVSGTSAIGQNAAINNYGISFDDLTKIINLEIKDKKLSKELVSELIKIKSSNQPIEKGKLSKFSDIIKKHENLVIPIGNFLIKLFFDDSVI